MEFRNGGMHIYEDIWEDEWLRFKESNSVGGYYDREIKGHYVSERVTGGVELVSRGLDEFLGESDFAVKMAEVPDVSSMNNYTVEYDLILENGVSIVNMSYDLFANEAEAIKYEAEAIKYAEYAATFLGIIVQVKSVTRHF